MKGQVAAERVVEGALVNEVARRHSLKPGHLSVWRTLAPKASRRRSAIRRRSWQFTYNRTYIFGEYFRLNESISKI
ncbi:transposase [Falsirhodobacter sp. 1013]|uniref:transposase n=1 Tax=Falsirhodobacter sp. 1013 TaxID=3417566 RepID=UPI003EBAE263